MNVSETAKNITVNTRALRQCKSNSGSKEQFFHYVKKSQFICTKNQLRVLFLFDWNINST